MTAPRAHVDRFRPDIEGLRAVAVLLVVLYHAVPRAMPGGFVGVDVFFVISGFLITRLLVREAVDGRVSFLAFYARRARRILPAAALTTVVTLVAATLLLSPLETERVLKDALASAGFVMNYRLAFQGTNYLTASLPPSPLQHYWSLSVEEQFYVLWPALLAVAAWAGRRWGGRRLQPEAAIALVLLAVFSASLWASIALTSTSPIWAYYSLWTRAYELAGGGLIAVLMSRLGQLPEWTLAALGWCGIAAVGFAAGAFQDTIAFPGDAALVPVLGTAAVIVAGSRTDAARFGVQRLLAIRPFQWLGARSYSWYLWHFPCLVLAPAAIGHSLTSAEALGVAAVSLVVAAITFRTVEQPIRRLRPLVARPRLGLAAGLCSVVAVLGATFGVSATLPSLVGAGAATHVLSGFPTPLSGGLTTADVQADLGAGALIRKVPANLSPPLSRAGSALPIVYSDGCHLAYPVTVNPPCIFGDRTSKTVVLLFGDSHAAQWFPALDRISRRNHWRLVSWTKSGCPPVDVVMYRPGHIAFPTCAAWRRKAEVRIARMHPYLVITSWNLDFVSAAVADPNAPKGYGTAWDDGVAATFKDLASSSKHVVFLEDTPKLGDVPGCLSAHLSDARKCTASLSSAFDHLAEARRERQLAHTFGVRELSTSEWFCTRTLCPTIVGNMLIYRGDNHITPVYSKFLAPVLAHALHAALADGRAGAAAS